MPGTALPSAQEIHAALGAVDFPAGKDELVRAAQDAGADESIVAALRSLPLADYANRDEVVRSVDTVEATGTAPSEHAAAARAGAPPGLAQHQRTGATG
jgi:Protein of unknown function (DUF2795)